MSLAIILALSLGTSVSAASVENFAPVDTYTPGQFTDVKAGAWYEEGIAGAWELGLVKGMSGDRFEPDGNLTIAQTLVLAARLHSIYNTGSADFEQGSPWYQVYLDYCVEQGIVGAGEYTDMGKAATRAEFAMIFAAAMPKEAYEEYLYLNYAEGCIPDVYPEDECYGAVHMLYCAGILKGSDERGSFMPDTGIKRSEVATIVTRMAIPEKRVEFVPGLTIAEENREEMDGVYLSADGLMELRMEGGVATLGLMVKYPDGSAEYVWYRDDPAAEFKQYLSGWSYEGSRESYIDNISNNFYLLGSCLEMVEPNKQFPERISFYKTRSDPGIISTAEKYFGGRILPSEVLNRESVADIAIGAPDHVYAGEGYHSECSLQLSIAGYWHEAKPEIASWYSFDMDIVMVSGGQLHGVSPGSTQLGAYLDGKFHKYMWVQVDISPGDSVMYVSNFGVSYDESSDAYIITYSLLDAEYNYVEAMCEVDIMVESDNGNWMYTGALTVNEDEYTVITDENGLEHKVGLVTLPRSALEVYDNTASGGTIGVSLRDPYGAFLMTREYVFVDNLPTAE